MIRPPETETGLLTTSNSFPLAICPSWQVAYDKLQWILQHWRTPQWRDRAFCRTRAGLELSIRELVGREHQAAVSHLPDWHPSVAAVPEPKWYRHGASRRLDLRGSTKARGRGIRSETPLEVVSSVERPAITDPGARPRFGGCSMSKRTRDASAGYTCRCYTTCLIVPHGGRCRTVQRSSTSR